MNRDNSRYKLFTRRAAVLAGAKLTLFAAVAARMYQLQVVDSQRYAMLADENRINLRLVAPPRGRILDRYGEQLAVNETNYRVVLVPEQTGSVPATLDVLATIVTLDDADRRRIMREVARKRRFLPVAVKDNLTWDEVARIAINAPDLPGVSIDVGLTRHYPHADVLAHALGYVAPPSEADLTGDPLLELPDFRIGRNGVERVFDLALRGRAGASHVEVNALGRPIRELDRNDGEAGQDVVLTLDLHLQKFASARIANEQSGAAVLMDVHSGAVLALASVPAYDPNEFNRGIPVGIWRSLITNTKAPLTNKAVAGQYAPGSTFKMAVALAALDAGVLTPEWRASCPGFLNLGDHRFHCWKKGGHGGVDMLEGLRQSCDVYFYEVARKVGPDRIAAMARRLGLGHAVGLDLPGERAGLIPTRDWKLATYGIPWLQGETLNTGIGQGYVLTTPLQLALMTARLVNGGYAVVPHLSRDVVNGRRVAARPRPAFPPLGVSAQWLAVIRRGMSDVVNSERGTAFKARIKEPDMAMGGKTGTAQVRRITEEERRVGLRKPDQVPWLQRDHAVFVGYAPVDAPRVAVAVLIEHGGGGSSVAAPIARDILIEAQKRERQRLDPLQRVAEARPKRA